jgi:D-amino peptidase
MKRSIAILAGFLLVAGSAAAQASKPGLKVFVSADLEGIWGVVHGDQTSSESSEYGPARRWMTDDINAVVAGLFDAGATEVVVNDSHGSQRNIIPDDLDPRAALISGSPKPLLMMQGIGEPFQACLFIGCHAKAGTEAAILDHTISSSVVYGIRINGIEMPELGINAAIAGAFGVPVIMVSGDTACCAQAKALLGEGTVVVPVKEAYARYAARLFPRDAARKALRDGAREALLRRAAAKVYRLEPPCRFEVGFHASGQAELPMLLPGVVRTDARTVAFSTNDYVGGFKLMRAMIALGSGR